MGYPHLTHSQTSIFEQGWQLVHCSARNLEWPVMPVWLDRLLLSLMQHCLPHCRRSILLPAVSLMPGHPQEWQDLNEGLCCGVQVRFHSHCLRSIPPPTSPLLLYHFWTEAVVNSEFSVPVRVMAPIHLHCLSSTPVLAFAPKPRFPHPQMSPTCLDHPRHW